MRLWDLISHPVRAIFGMHSHYLNALYLGSKGNSDEFLYLERYFSYQTTSYYAYESRLLSKLDMDSFFNWPIFLWISMEHCQGFCPHLWTPQHCGSLVIALRWPVVCSQPFMTGYWLQINSIGSQSSINIFECSAARNQKQSNIRSFHVPILNKFGPCASWRWVYHLQLALFKKPWISRTVFRRRINVMFWLDRFWSGRSYLAYLEGEE